MIDAVFIAAMIALFIASFTAGLVFSDRRGRIDDRRERKTAQAELTGLLKTIAAEHNKLVVQISEFSDRLGVVDLKASGALGKARPMNPAPGRI